MNLPTLSFRLLPSRLLAALVAAALGCVSTLHSVAQEAEKASTPTPEMEAKFIATLTDATLKGRFSSIKDGEMGPAKEDSYHVVSVTKIEGEKWQVKARMSIAGRSIDLPIPVLVKWAGDTPVLVLDNVNIGTGRAYGARVMIYEKTYAGWWTALDHGGIMSGVITNAAK